MKETLTFRSVVTHAQHVGPGIISPVSFFTDDPEGSVRDKSIRDASEAAIVHWLLRRHESRSLICGELGLAAAATHRFRVTEPVLQRRNSKPGDIDWLCAELTAPQFAFAAECKRVKARACKDGHDHVNKIDSLGEGVPQVNALAALGIHRTFLVIVVAVDGSMRTENNVVFRGVTDQTFRRIYDFPWRDRLAEDVGIVFVEAVQPTGRAVNDMVSVGIGVARQARLREQSQDLTNRIRRALTAQ